MTIGEELRAARKRFGYTLKDLAEMTHFSVGYLSTIERGTTSPTIAHLKLLCNALRLDIVALMKAERDPSPLMKKAGRKTIYTGKDGVLENIVVDNDVYRCTCYTMAPDFRGDMGIPEGDSGDVLCYLLSGALEVNLAGDTYEMEAGDTIFIQSGKPYSFRQKGTEKNVTLWFYLRRPAL